jgi:hypothetical protein
MSEQLEATAKLYDDAAHELDRAARLAAHAWAALGHIRKAEARLDEQAQTHAERSNVD